MGGSVRVEFLAPNPKFTVARLLRDYVQSATELRRLGRLGGPGIDLNLVSACLRVRYGDTNVLLAGDMMNQAWDVLLFEEQIHDPRAHVFKVPHHGSRHSNFPTGGPLCGYVQPAGKRLTALISGGYLADLPHSSTVQSLTRQGASVYMTGAGYSAETRPFPEAPFELSVIDTLRAAGALVEEVVPECKSACGDIRVDCYADGRVDVFPTVPISGHS